MKVFTNYQIKMDQPLTFWGDGNGELEIGDIVYLWQDRNNNGLGEEIIYGTAQVTKVLQNNYFEVKRIA